MELLSTFWKTYRWEHGTHAVYQKADAQQLSLEHTIPLLLHGDGGRTQKKQPLEIVSISPMLGLNTEQGSLKCHCSTSKVYHGKRKLDPMAQRLNLKNSSYTTHFLLFAYPGKKFKKTPGIFRSLLRAVCLDLGMVCENGVSCIYRGAQYQFRFAVLGMKGDQEWHAKSGLLTRSFLNVGTKNPYHAAVIAWLVDLVCRLKTSPHLQLGEPQ